MKCGEKIVGYLGLKSSTLIIKCLHTSERSIVQTMVASIVRLCLPNIELLRWFNTQRVACYKCCTNVCQIDRNVLFYDWCSPDTPSCFYILTRLGGRSVLFKIELFFLFKFNNRHWISFSHCGLLLLIYCHALSAELFGRLYSTGY